jgi:hypothetical protein
MLPKKQTRRTNKKAEKQTPYTTKHLSAAAGVQGVFTSEKIH